jgi:signal transduction histidine kinase
MARARKRSDRPDRSDAPDEVVRLRELLTDARATLRAIRNGEVDAVVVESKLGPQVFTLDSAEFDYRILIESMNEGALVLTRGALIVYANRHFALMVERPLAQLMGSSMYELLSAADQATLRRLLRRPGRLDTSAELLLQRPHGAPMPAKISIRRLPGGDAKDMSIGMVVSDLTEFRKREDVLRSFSQGLMETQEAEREQVATDLGDNITQLLLTILLRCQLLAERLPAHEHAFRDETGEFVELLRTTASQLHRISTDLRPSGLEILGLDSALRAMVAEFAARMGVSIKVSCARLTARLPARAELALFRVLQEALDNVEQHAQAQHVSVALRRRGAGVQLTIKDDGIGFDTSGSPDKSMRAGRFGLLSMRERALALGGSLKVMSAISGGTEILLNVPLAPLVARLA